MSGKKQNYYNRRKGAGRQFNNSQAGSGAGYQSNSNPKQNANNRTSTQPQSNNNGPPNGRQVKSYPISLGKLNEYINDFEDGELILHLSNEDGGFITLLKQNQIAPAQMFAVLSALGKVADSATDGHTRHLLIHFYNNLMPKPNSATISLETHLQLFVSKLWAQLDPSGSDYAKNTKAITDLLKFIRNLQETLLAASVDFVKNVVIPLGGIFEHVNRKGCILSHDIMELYDQINETLEQFAEGKKEDKPKNGLELVNNAYQPPNDFRSISVCPRMEDIQTDREQFVPVNIVNGRYMGGVDHYLDVQFRLLREDFLRPLREGISEYIRLARTEPKKLKNCKKVQDLYVYSNVRVVGSSMQQGELSYTGQLDADSLAGIRWTCSKRLMTGSLVCFSPDNFQTSLCFGTISGYRDPSKLSKGEFNFKFEFENRLSESLTPATTLVMVESLIYFEAYRHNLHVLQSFSPTNFPLQEYLVDVDPNIENLPYLSEDSVYDLSRLTLPLDRDHDDDAVVRELRLSERAARCKAVKVLDDRAWPDAIDMGLDDSQYRALKSALTKQISIIQGPPGTGKTYVGLRIAQALLQNELRRWMPGKTSVLVVCYTNHALDQFLEGIFAFQKNIVRIGGKSQSAILEPINLTQLRRRDAPPKHILHNRWEVRTRINYVHSLIYDFENEINRTMKDVMGYQLAQFMVASELQQLKSHFEQLSGYENFEEELLVFLGIRFRQSDAAQFEMRDDDPPENVTPPPPPPNDDQAANIADAEDENGAAAMNLEDDEADEEEILYIEAMRIVDGYNDEDLTLGRRNDIGEQPQPELNVEVVDNEGFALQINKKDHKRKIQKELTSTDVMTEAEANRVYDIWHLRNKDRWRLYRYWVRRYIAEKETQVQILRKRLNEEWQQFQAIRQQLDIEVVRKCDVIGMTTTGAAKYHHLIEKIKPRIMIVEEAAEVLEAHIITSLSSQTEHLILIGDHQQLKPNPAVYELARKHNLEVSLFERLIENKLPHFQLRKQHRMRPEISSLLVPHIYKELEDHPCVYNYDNVKGVSTNLFFVDHNEMEKAVGETSSHMNEHEARFAVQLARYLILQGYAPSQITILTMYSGQLFQLRALMKDLLLLHGVRATVVDNYQGEENDIIIITFVRSNLEGNVGFLKVSNRVNVALSRAKKGLFGIGNFECLTEKSLLWRKIVEVLKQQHAIGPALSLYCQNHKDMAVKVSKETDFKQVPEGGCTLPCDARLECGHICPSTCHIADAAHESIKCNKPCPNTVCERGHKCTRKCHLGQDCVTCSVMVDKVRPICGHTVKVKCSEGTSNVYCNQRCSKKLTCGHACSLPCGRACDNAMCTAIIKTKGPCGHTVHVKCSLQNDFVQLSSSCTEPCRIPLKCGHICPGTCGKCLQGRLHVNCEAKCDRPMVCNHLCKAKCSENCPPCEVACPNECVHSRCRKVCGYPCVPCKENCVWSCPHKRCTKLCHETCDRGLCMEPCKKQLKCNHPCIGLCGEPCPQLCRICDKDKVETIFFGTEDEPGARFIQLSDCKHVIEVTGLINWLEMDVEGKEDKGINMKTCPLCKTVIRKTRSLNIYTQEGLRDLELVKIKSYGNLNANKERQKKLNNEITEFQLEPLQSRATNEELRVIYAGLKNKTVVIPKRAALPISTIMEKENLFDILTKLYEIYRHVEPVLIINRGYADSTTAKQIADRATQILRFLKGFKNSEQQRLDIGRELSFLQYLAKVLEEISKRNWNVAGQGLLKQAFDIALPNGPITDEARSKFKQLVEEASKLQSGIGISIEEKAMVLNAMGLGKGHWYKCPNGHVYAIGDCGGAMVQSKCPDCGASIGGGSHRLLRDNALAPEMDGATQSAWPGGMY